MNNQHAYIRYDSKGKIVAGSLIIRREIPKVGIWREVPMDLCCIPVPPILEGLILIWDDILNVPVLDPTSVILWNIFFDLPLNGNVFTSVSVIGNEVTLIGGSGITLKDLIFTDNTSLIAFIDTTSCITAVGTECFRNCYFLTTCIIPNPISVGDNFFESCLSLTTVDDINLISVGSGGFSSLNVSSINLPNLLSVGDFCFNDCTNLTVLNVPNLLNIGSTTGDDNVFASITGNNITLTIPAALMTCNDGITTFDPDGDIQYLVANNTVIIIQV